MTLNGIKAPTRTDRNVETSGSEVNFSTDLGMDGYRSVPALKVNARHFTDSAAKDIKLSPEKLGSIDSLEALKKVVSETFEANKDYLEASEFKSKNETLGVAGLRKQAFFSDLAKTLGTSALPEDQLVAGGKLLRIMEEETYMNKDIEFDTGELDSYHPYGQPFDKGVRKIEGLAPEGIERDNITGELNYIVDRKTKYGWGKLNERNAESTLGLRVIDRGNDGQAISVAKDSIDPRHPSYVLINVNTENLPEGFEEHADKAVIRDDDKLFFDKTDTEVPAELAEHLTEKAASETLGLRTFEPDEQARANFPYDWNRNGGVDVDPINTGWWGHCHIEAPLASLDLTAGSEVTIFDARSKNVKHFGDTDVNDLLFAMMDADRYSDMRSGRSTSVAKTNFVGNRNDTVGGALPGDKLILETNGREMPFSLRVKELYEVGDSEKKVDANAMFQPTVVTEGIKFEKNPSFNGIRNTDWSNINGERKIVAEIEYLDIGANGSVERKSLDITIDPTNPSDEPVLVGSKIGQGFPASVTRYYLNEKTGNIESKEFKAKKQDDGTYKAEATSDEATIIGKVQGKTLTRELTKESIIELHNHVLNAARRGVSFVTEKSTGYMVWNYGTDGLRMNKVEEDGDFVKYNISLETQGGTKSWDYTLKYDETGNVVDAHGIGEPADFVWRPEESISAPLVKHETTGAILYNSAAHERGFLLDADGRLSAKGMSFFKYATDVIYASLADTTKENRFVVIDDQGEMYFYDDKEVFVKDITGLGGTSEALEEQLPKPSPIIEELLPTNEVAVNTSPASEEASETGGAATNTSPASEEASETNEAATNTSPASEEASETNEAATNTSPASEE